MQFAVKCPHRLNSLTMFTGALGFCMNHSREHDGKGKIVGYIPAKEYSGQSDLNTPTCTLELTDIPQYSVVELVINRYVLPSGCDCTQNGASMCNYITVTISNNVNRFCSPTTDPVYTYKSNKKSITIVSTRRNYNHAVNFSLTYRGEC